MRCGIYVRVSTDDQRDNGYSIDSQLRMIKEYCEKNEYDIVDVYNDAGHSGKDLLRPDMQRLLKDIKSHKLEKLIAIKVDRLTRNNYDGFWLLNYCEEHDVKIELILEPYDVSTANGEMIFGMNLVFGQRERKEIGARTKRAMEEMALERVHPSKAPYGYIRNKETGHLEIEPIEAEVIKDIFNLCKQGKSVRGIATIMKDTNRYLKTGKWKSDRVYKILTNSIYIGTFAFGKYKRKAQDILYVENYCEKIIDNETWNVTRKVLEKNKHPNYGEHIHLFTSLVKCPDCGGILSSTNSFKNSGTPKEKVYYHLTCKNPNCKSKGLHYNCDKIEKQLTKILNELTRYIQDNTNEILTSNSKKSTELKDIDKAIDKLKIQEKKLVDLYLSSSLNVEVINQKNENIKKENNKSLYIGLFLLVIIFCIVSIFGSSISVQIKNGITLFYIGHLFGTIIYYFLNKSKIDKSYIPNIYIGLFILSLGLIFISGMNIYSALLLGISNSFYYAIPYYCNLIYKNTLSNLVYIIYNVMGILQIAIMDYILNITNNSIEIIVGIYIIISVIALCILFIIDGELKEKIKKMIEKEKKETLLLDFSDTEKNIVELILKDYSNKEIAKTVFLSPNTIKFHIKNIFNKLKINSRKELIYLFK